MEVSHADDWVQCDERRLAALKEIDKEEKRLRDTLNEIFLPEKDDVVRSGTNTDWLKDAADSVDVEFISHRPDRLVTRHTNDMTEKLLNLLKGAQSDVNIISPYLVPTENLMEAFRELRVKGIPIRIITNSLKSTDNLFAQAAYRFRKNELIRMGIEIYEYNGPNTVHAKTAIIDGQVGLIGTYNLDPRSAFINREIGFIMKDSNNNELIKQLESTIEKFRSNSFLVGRDGVEHNKDKEFEGVSSGKKKLLHGVTLLLPLIYNQI
ncbi:MAG: hypothetical protein BroJett040_10930 [Oligoflexia bacterium]|nr:MAG: hypothetical protein BroJett040_10930 [Oligoflexia bacterium]